MGRDLHVVVETIDKTKRDLKLPFCDDVERTVTDYVESWKPVKQNSDCIYLCDSYNRNYELYGLLSKYRYKNMKGSQTPKGIPKDLCQFYKDFDDDKYGDLYGSIIFIDEDRCPTHHTLAELIDILEIVKKEQTGENKYDRVVDTTGINRPDYDIVKYDLSNEYNRQILDDIEIWKKYCDENEIKYDELRFILTYCY